MVLLFINLWLQVFDGLATYLGVSAGYGEGNPLVAATFGQHQGRHHQSYGKRANLCKFHR